MNGTFSDELVLNTGAPQGCVLSPLMFSIYTDELKIDSTLVSLYKYADDMALVGLLVKERSLCRQVYFDHVLALQDWCSSSSLFINVGKTKELIFDSSDDHVNQVTPVFLNDEPVEIVDSFKYLGTHIDSNFSFKQNADFIFKKANQRLYLMRQLRSFGVSTSVLQKVYRSLVESILSFNITVWYNRLDAKSKGKLSRVVNEASKIVGTKQNPLSDVFNTAVRRKSLAITKDTTHALHTKFEKLPSGRRYRVPFCSKNIYKQSFLPTAIAILNS